MATYTPTIGLEIHAELKTASKMFCGCKNAPDEHGPNELTCPVCLGHPGTLPVINRQAVESVVRVGIAVGGSIADYTEFDRKNYFYPDIPKGYQISQYQYPLVQGGSLAGITITRIHLEEDTAKSTHDTGDESLIDFNRSGVPLMELVTEPVIHTPEAAGTFARELRLLLRYLGASDADMEKGQMRVEANVSVSATSELGTKVEVKNLNSFKSVEKAIAHEIERQTKLLEAGTPVEHETRGWDEVRQVTFSQRKKERSHDYRYFPDPDLPKLILSENKDISVSRIREMLPELPEVARQKLLTLGLASDTAEVLVQNPELGGFFTAVLAALPSGKQQEYAVLASNYIATDVQALVKSADSSGRATPPLADASGFAKLIDMAGSGALSSKGVKTVLPQWYAKGGDPGEIAQALNALQNSDPAYIVEIVQKIIALHPDPVAEYKAGKASTAQFLIGQAMKESKGSANPAMLQEMLLKELER